MLIYSFIGHPELASGLFLWKKKKKNPSERFISYLLSLNFKVLLSRSWKVIACAAIVMSWLALSKPPWKNFAKGLSPVLVSAGLRGSLNKKKKSNHSIILCLHQTYIDLIKRLFHWHLKKFIMSIFFVLLSHAKA